VLLLLLKAAYQIFRVWPVCFYVVTCCCCLRSFLVAIVRACNLCVQSLSLKLFR